MYRFYKNRCFRNFVIAFSFISLLSFNLNSKNANAVAFVDDVVIGGGVTVSTGALAALAGSTLVAGGVYLDATLNDGDISKYLVNKMISTGNAMEYWGVKTLESGKQVLVWTQKGVEAFKDALEISCELGYVPSIDEYNFASTTLTSYAKTPVILCSNVAKSFDYKFGDGPVRTISSAISGVLAYCVDSYWGTLVGIYDLSNKEWIITQSYGNWGVYSGPFKYRLTNGESICVDMDPKYKDIDFGKVSDVIGGSSSVGSYQPNIGIPLNNNDTGVMFPGIDFPYNKSWDELFPDISVPLDEPITGNPDISVPVEGSSTGTIEATETGSWVLNIPILGDILRVLLDILALLKTFIANLLTGLLDLIKTVCIPSDTYFENIFNEIKGMIFDKIGYDQYVDIFGDGSSKELKDITINWYGKTIVICKLTTFNYFRNLFNDLVYGFTFFGLAIYNYNQIYRIFRNNNYAKMEQTIERMKK